jgi:hypothetical protein
MAFAKLDSGITKSSLWSEPLHVRIVFVSMLAEKDENGFVSAARSGMIRICNVTPEQFEEAEKILSSPDLESKNPSFEGRRIEKIDGGWAILNHDAYRLPEQEKKENRNEYMRIFMANKRANKRANKKLTPANSDLTSVSVSVSVSESVSESIKNKEIKENNTLSALLESVDRIYALYPTRDLNNNSRPTHKSFGDKRKIENLLKRGMSEYFLSK